MSVPASMLPDALLPLDELLSATREIVDQDLKPLTVKIDLEGLYPEEVLQPDRIGSVYAADVQIFRDDAGRPVVVALRSRIRYSAPADGSYC